MNGGIYIHVPFCLHRCSYCTFYSTTDRVPEATQYAAALAQHLARLMPCLDSKMVVDTVYFGGGTPSCMSPDFFEQVLRLLDNNLAMDGNPEITMEVNPETVDRAYLEQIRQVGFNRVSIGIQSMDPAVLNRLDRVHSAETAEQTVVQACALFDNVSVDFMIGIAGMNRELFCSIPRDILDRVQHVSVYILEGEHTLGMQMDGDHGAAQYLAVCEYLEKHGLIQYEISNFSRPGFQSRHNLHYWNGDPYLGLGPSAHSYLGGIRLADETGLREFLDGAFRLTEIRTTAEEQAREETMLALRLCNGVEPGQIAAPFRQVLHGELKVLSARFPDLLREEGGRFCLTRKGMLLSNELFEQILFPKPDQSSEMGDS